MIVEDFKAALRQACDIAIASQAEFSRTFAAALDEMVALAKADPDTDGELIDLIFASELKRFGVEMDKL